ncbi:DgyrCDS239 [Dimorphilus gyrociliatus]|uniref:DgyrCDS239 n=1 Tax=Dimorphilus gyrociliatus TaxID=2664684 RepID=A0A7I8V474_9ANNE|nr:DgyrCDS239 [Dimorphilus gyrociliatus]
MTPLKINWNSFIKAYKIDPKESIHLDEDWTFFVNHQYLEEILNDEMLLVEFTSPEEQKEDSRLFDVPVRYRTKFSEMVTPVAWKSDESIKILVQCTLKSLADLCRALQFDNVVYEDNLNMKCLTTAVNLSGRAKSLLQTEEKKTEMSTFAKDKANSDDKQSTGQKQTIPKPPNVLVYTERSAKEDSFLALKETLRSILGANNYTFYHLSEEKALGYPWKENTTLLIIMDKTLKENINKMFYEYYINGGNVLSLCCRTFEENFLEVKDKGEVNIRKIKLECSEWKDVPVFGCCNISFENFKKQKFTEIAWFSDDTRRPAILFSDSEDNSGKVILSHVQWHIEIKHEQKQVLKHLLSSYFEIKQSQEEDIQLTQGYLISKQENSRRNFLKHIEVKLTNGILRSNKTVLKFGNTEKDTPSENFLPINIASNCNNFKLFNSDEYFHHLSTKTLGKILIYADMMGSTQNVFDSLQFSTPKDLGIASIASRQISGVGRGGNAWLSPPGSLCLSFHTMVSLKSKLGQHVSYAQHIAALAVVNAIRDIKEYRNLDLRIKWPNDIYYKDKAKIGGILVDSSVFKDQIHLIIGIGVNVSNSKPTLSINDIINRYNKKAAKSLEKFTVPKMGALIISKFEELVDLYENEQEDNVSALYYEKWIHSGTEVELWNGTKAKIVDLDEYGYLRVFTESEEIVSVHPDGNSFDMTRGLILPKIK